MSENRARRERPLVIVAFGGNALLRADDLGTLEEQWQRARDAASALVDLLEKGEDVLLVHGNGPQVGQVLLQMEEAVTKVPSGTVDVAVAQTQGSIGYLLEASLRNEIHRRGAEREVACLLSLVGVDAEDPGFHSPTKPIGPFYTSFRARALERDLGWTLVEDAGRGWRKVVSSPRPIEVLNLSLVKKMLADRALVIFGGGGGIPVVRQPDGELRGVEAVIDKDRTAALIGSALEADVLLNLTGVPAVYEGYGTSGQRVLTEITVDRAVDLLGSGEFPPGSMGPKMEACVDFVENTGGRAVITDIENVRPALDGKAGTAIVKS